MDWDNVFRRLGRSTSGGVRNGLATFLAGRYRTPEEHVSEVQRGDTILTSQVPDPAELSFREYVRACKLGSGQAKAKDSFPFEFLLNVPAGGHVALRKRPHCPGVHDGFDLLVGHTRDGSFCCTCHPRHFRPRCSW